MRIGSVLFSLALLISPIIAVPIAAKYATVTCTAKDVTEEKRLRNVSWKISVATAKAEMAKAGISHQGKTDYPHPFSNFQGFDWGVATCKKTNMDLLEYPVFWKRHAPIDNTKRTNQQARSPIRVVYANDGGVMVYCGVMTHADAERLNDMSGQESWTGKEGFKICT